MSTVTLGSLLLLALVVGCHADVMDDLKEQCDIAHDKITACEEATDDKLNGADRKTFQMLFFQTRRARHSISKKQDMATSILEQLMSYGPTGFNYTASSESGSSSRTKRSKSKSSSSSGSGEHNPPHPYMRYAEELAGCEELVRDEIDCSDPFHQQFRSIDGICNNLYYPEQGAAFTVHRRLVHNTYENRVNLPRGWSAGTQYNGYDLPSPRLVATVVASSPDFREDNKLTEMIMQWGQFLDHDMAFTPFVDSLVSFETGSDCEITCVNDYPCFPIPTPLDDPRIPQDKCMGLIRSAAACNVDPNGWYERNQINDLTSYLDAGNVYGNTEEISTALRDLAPNRGLLRVGAINSYGKPLLPVEDENAPAHSLECLPNLVSGNPEPCFFAGDRRVNDQIALIAMHTIWMREHNRIAERLNELHPDWDGDRVYHTARKIVGGEQQVITYRTWLPKILGRRGIRMIDDYSGYDPYVDATVSNEFVTAVYRMGHGTIRPELFRLDENFEVLPIGNIPLREAFFNPASFFDTGLDPLLRGLFGIPAKRLRPQQMVTEEITEALFEHSFEVALDLASLNIQRGRDHGIGTYNDLREFCGLGRADDFKDLRDDIPKKVVDKLEEVYGDVNNVDAWPGIMAERAVNGGRVGPTIQCVFREQFTRLRDGDRFYYENPEVFTEQQRDELEKTTLAKVVCTTANDIQIIQEDIFEQASPSEMVPCEDLPEVDLSAWA